MYTTGAFGIFLQIKTPQTIFLHQFPQLKDLENINCALSSFKWAFQMFYAAYLFPAFLFVTTPAEGIVGGVKAQIGQLPYIVSFLLHNQQGKKIVTLPWSNEYFSPSSNWPIPIHCELVSGNFECKYQQNISMKRRWVCCMVVGTPVLGP